MSAMRAVGLVAGLALLVGVHCGSDDSPASDATPTTPSYDKAGAAPVGHQIFELEDSSRSRKLLVQAWYPAAEAARSAAVASIEELVPAGADRDALATAVAAAPERCTSRKTGSVAGAEVAAGVEKLPTVVFSHCMNCLRFSAFSVAERLASHGFLVLAPDHTDGTYFDELAGKSAPLNDDFLAVRAGDIRFVAGAALSGEGMPGALKGRADGDRLGMMGHSFGGLTTGKVLVDDDRFKAGFVMAAPPAFLGGVKMTSIAEPIFLLLAQEDNSIGTLGNDLMRSNFKDAAGKAWLSEVEDAGHWSFSNICGLTEGFMPGCGVGKRQKGKAEFNYLDIDEGRDIAASYAAAFFALTLKGDASAEAYLTAPRGRVQHASR